MMMRIKVLPSSEDMMKHLKHPCGVKFVSMGVPVEWPDDQFTTRRLIEGSIHLFEDRPPPHPKQK